MKLCLLIGIEEKGCYVIVWMFECPSSPQSRAQILDPCTIVGGGRCGMR